jgi:hypothetical protein
VIVGACVNLYVQPWAMVGCTLTAGDLDAWLKHVTCMCCMYGWSIRCYITIVASCCGQRSAVPSRPSAARCVKSWGASWQAVVDETSSLHIKEEVHDVWHA